MFQEAAEAYRATGLPLGEHYTEYADVLMELLLLPEASERSPPCRGGVLAAGVPLMAAESQLRVAQLAMLAGDSAAAIAASTAAATAFRQQTRATWRARAMLVTAEARLKSGTAKMADLAKARAAAERLESPGHHRRGGAGLPGNRRRPPP